MILSIGIVRASDDSCNNAARQRLPGLGRGAVGGGGGRGDVDDVGGPRLVRSVRTRLVRAGEGGSHRVQALGRPRTQLLRCFGLEVGHGSLSWCVVCGLDRARPPAAGPTVSRAVRTGSDEPVRATQRQTVAPASRSMCH